MPYNATCDTFGGSDVALFAVRSKRQRDNRKGQFFISRRLERAVVKAVILSKKQKRHFYVVIIGR